VVVLRAYPADEKTQYRDRDPVDADRGCGFDTVMGSIARLGGSPGMGLSTVVIVFAHGWSSGGTVLTVSHQREEAKKRKSKFIVAKSGFFDVCIQCLLWINEAGSGHSRSGCRIP
jgi:predicted ATP-dependent serine protease